jgi:hypothetical protein
MQERLPLTQALGFPRIMIEPQVFLLFPDRW